MLPVLVLVTVEVLITLTDLVQKGMDLVLKHHFNNI
jgi:hypothetical protein